MLLTLKAWLGGHAFLRTGLVWIVGSNRYNCKHGFEDHGSIVCACLPDAGHPFNTNTMGEPWVW